MQPFWISDNRNRILRYINEGGIKSTPALTSTDAVYLDNDGFGGPWDIALDTSGQRLCSR